ncbi:MAG TPA: YciI family protein [Propionibacteriaceae bacterium]|nr:YciI family protein [Propionibacteriaceae bacterium]
MTILMIEYHVEDFKSWKAVFDSDPMDRASYGVVKHWIYRDPDDPNHHMLGMEFAAAEQAKEFREALVPMLEVSGAGQAWILEQPEEAEAPSPMRKVGATPTNHFVYKLIPPRPTFPVDITDAEAAIMEQHFAYWSRFEQRGIVVVLGPVLDPSGTWGLGVIAGRDSNDISALGAEDPAVKSGMSTFEVYEMADPFIRS